jgi:hypothetical protein
MVRPNMCKKKTVGVYLTGGLGNQLFQLAAAMSIAEESEIEVIEKPGRPRLNSNNDPELFSLSVNQIANIHRRKVDGFLLRRSTGYVLRTSIWPHKVERNRLIVLATKVAATIVQSLQIRKPYFPLSISDVGYSDVKRRAILEKVFNPFLIGYFQSFVWPESVQNRLRLLMINQEGPDLHSLRIEAESIAPIIVHIRRGDYRAETTFGLPGEKYYRSAIDIINLEYSNHPIWVFSDDVDEAREVLSWLPSERVKYISDVDKQSAASFMAMRLGCAYIIANSTFSWWGAFLSDARNPLVIAPEPWFIGQREPRLLIPKDWIRVQY